MPLFDDALFDGAGLTPPPAPPAPPPGYLGRFQLGQSVPLAVTCVDALGFATTPDAAPTATVVAPDGSTLAAMELALDPGGDTSRFGRAFLLDSAPALGTYSVTYSYLLAGVPLQADGSFDAIPGGDPGGAVISLFGYDRPEARYVVAQLASGRLVQGRNPR